MANTYVTMKDVSLSNQVNNGNPINILANEVVWNFGSYVQTPQVPSKATTYPWNYRLANSDYVGHANPTINIRGVIPSGGETSGPTTPTWLTFKILWEMAKSGHEFVLWEHKMIQPLVSETPVGEPYPPYQNDSGMRVRVLNISVTRQQDSEHVKDNNMIDRGYILTYEMELVEVKSS